MRAGEEGDEEGESGGEGAASVAGRSGEGGIAGRTPTLTLSPPPPTPPPHPLPDSYTDVAKSTGDDLKELTTLRAMACGKRNALATATMDDEGEPTEGEQERTA